MPPPNASAPKKPNPNTASNERNEYIPSFISKKPFYVTEDNDLTHATTASDTSKDYLEHQRLTEPTNTSSLLSSKSQWYDRGLKRGPAATKYRKGACENCGAMGHGKKDCLSRPRKVGAKFTGKDIQADDLVNKFDMGGWEAKRDRWNGYDTKEYKRVVEDYNELEKVKRLKRGDGEDVSGERTGSDNEDEMDGDRYEEETDMGRAQSTSTRTLRLREDTAKYLVNLDLESAKYDPKTRRMVDGGTKEDESAKLVADEGFVRKGGEAAEFEKAQTAAWESQERGDNSVHIQANPTSGAYLRKKQAEETEAKKVAQRKLLAEKYGNQEKFQTSEDSRPAVVESEEFKEYDERGRVKGGEKSKEKSMYAEDVFTNNHTSVWGSWWKDFKWGYACCHSTVRNSYCTGDAGKEATEQAAEPESVLVREESNAEQQEVPKDEAWQEEQQVEKHVPNATASDRPLSKKSPREIT